MRRRFQAGLTMIELVVTLVIVSLTLGMVFWGLISLQTLWNNMLDQNTLVSQNRAALDTVVDHIRDAQPCQNASNGTYNSVIAASAAGYITYYTDSANCGTAKYYVASGNLYRLVGTTSTIVAQNVTGLTAVYYTSTSYNSATLTATTSANSPSSTELPNLNSALVTVNSSLNGKTASSSTWVRFRNSPKKATLAGS